MPDEEILYEGRVPFRVVHGSHGLLWLLLLGWNIGLLLSWFRTFGESLKITTQRIVLTSGMFSQEVEEVEYYRVKDTTYHQSLWQRLFGIGTITLLSDDATAPQLSFTMPDPHTYREQIRECINYERQRMGTVQLD